MKALQVDIRSLKAEMDILKANNVEIRALEADMEILKENNERLLNVTSALVGGAMTNYIEVMRNPDSGSLLRPRQQRPCGAHVGVAVAQRERRALGAARLPGVDARHRRSRRVEGAAC